MLPPKTDLWVGKLVKFVVPAVLGANKLLALPNELDVAPNTLVVPLPKPDPWVEELGKFVVLVVLGEK